MEDVYREKGNGMSCKICGRSNCTSQFHSIEEQNKYDDMAEPITDKIKEKLIHRVERLDSEYFGDDDIRCTWVKYDDVIDLINDL